MLFGLVWCLCSSWSKAYRELVDYSSWRPCDYVTVYIYSYRLSSATGLELSEGVGGGLILDWLSSSQVESRALCLGLLAQSSMVCLAFGSHTSAKPLCSNAVIKLV